MATQVKSMNEGIDIDDTNLSILLYADDIVILAPNDSNSQCMLNGVISGDKVLIVVGQILFILDLALLSVQQLVLIVMIIISAM